MIDFYLVVSVSSIFIFFIFSKIFTKLNITDKPDKVRKFHKGEVPLSGGVSLYTSFFVSFYLVNSLFYDQYHNGSSAYVSVFYISSLILALGLWDDIKPLPTALRLIFQIFASWLVIIITDIYLVDLGDLFGLGSLYLGSFGIPLTIFMVVGVCNAFNMLDGMDGLVGIVFLALSSAISGIAYLYNIHDFLFISTFITIIFLFFNLGILGKKIKIFLGDSGSTWLGFITAWFCIILSQGEERLFQPVTALWLILLPLIDALSTFISRIWSKKSMFNPDRTHIHHMLLDGGLNKRIVLLFFLSISALSSGFGIYASINSIPESRQFLGFLTVWFFYFLLKRYPLTKDL